MEELSVDPTGDGDAAGFRQRSLIHIYIGGTQLTVTQIQTVEILQQVAQGSFLLFGFPKVYLRVEVDGPEYIAQLSTCLFYTSRCV